MTNTLYNFSPRRTNFFVGFLLLYEICTYISNDMIMPGMLEVVKTFNAPISTIPLSLTAFILGGTSLQIIIGPLSDRYGRRPIMIAGALFFLLCTSFIGLSTSMNQFILARFFQGMGLCFISVVGYSTLQEIYTEMHAVRLVALMSNITILAPLGGPLLGALVLQFSPWRSIFFIIAIFAAISLIGLFIYMPETVNRQRLDGTVNPITSFKFKIILKNYFSLLKNSRFILGSFALGLANTPLIAWIGTSPLILIKNANLSIINYGLLQIPIFISVALGNLVMRKYSYQMSLTQIIGIGSKIIIVGILFTLVLLYVFNAHYLTFIFGFSVYAFGLGFSTPALNRQTLFATLVPKGTASALISIIAMLLTASGNELGGLSYMTFNNMYFGLFCAACGCAYFSIILCIKNN